MEFQKDKKLNKIYLAINYPFSNTEHVYYNKNGNESAFTDNNNVYYNAEQANIKKNIYNFVMNYCDESARTIDNVATVDLTRGTVRLPFGYRQGINYNYMVICKANNSTYDKKTNYYYCFIDGVEWSSNLQSCVIHFHIDSWNTYAPRMNLNMSYIEREHVANDSFGAHTIDEGLTPSNYKIINSSRVEIGAMTPVLALGSTNRIYYDNSILGMINPDALYPSDNYGYNPILIGEGNIGAHTVTIGESVDILTRAGVSDAIIGCYLMPSAVVHDMRDLYVVVDPTWEPPWGGSGSVPEYERIPQYITESEDYYTYGTIQKPSTPYGIPIKNNKTLCYPYCFANISNQLGNELTLKFENSNVSGHNISYRKTVDKNINGAVYLNAYDYDGLSGINCDYAIQTLNYPTLPFIVDSYDSYLSSNKNILANSRNYIDNDYNFGMKQGAIEADATQTLSQINNLMSVTGATASGGGALGGAGGIVRAFTDLYSQGTNAQLKINAYDYQRQKASDAINASLSDKAVMPDKFCGRYMPNNLLSNNITGFIVKTMCALPEELKAIDNYFSRFGYRVNTFDVPNLQNRKYFDYKKIIDINFTCECSTNDINIIKSMFNNGVTLWHDKNYIFNFNSNNTPN